MILTGAEPDEIWPLVRAHHYSHRMPSNIQHCYAVREPGGLFGHTGPVVAGIMRPVQWTSELPFVRARRNPVGPLQFRLTCHDRRVRSGRTQAGGGIVGLCSKCGEKHQRAGQRYCTGCHAAYNRKWRKTHPLSDEARKRDTARSHASVGKKRGQLVPLPCMVCGEPKSEMHHPDHELPRYIVWLCRPCHLGWHAFWRETVRSAWFAWFKKNKRSEAA